MNNNLHRVDKTRALIQLHIAVFLFGFTAILGDLITLDALVLVWWRMLMACAGLLFLRQVRTKLFSISKVQVRALALVGALVAAHWVTFFASVKLANASVALICYSMTALFTALLSPAFNRNTSIRRADVVLGATVIPGMALVIGNLDLDLQLGFWIGILSAVLISIFTHLNKRLVADLSPELMTTVELGTGMLLLGILLPFWLLQSGAQFLPAPSDWLYLLILALICTTLGYVIQLQALARLTAFTSNLAMNLEPVYGIILAYILLDDGLELNGRFYLGALIIVLAVVIQPFIFSPEKKVQT